MIRRLLTLSVMCCTLPTIGQVNISNSNKKIIETSKDSLISSQDIIIAYSDVKVSKREIRKAKKNKSKGSSFISFVEIKDRDSSLTKSGAKSTAISNTKSNKNAFIRPAFRPISVDQIDQQNLEQRQITNTQPNRRIVSMLNYKPHKIDTKTKRFFWVVEETHNGSSSHKSMKLVSHNAANKLIAKNKIEVNTKLGKYNSVVIWEVYDKDYFMQKQAENSHYYSSQESELFNTQPYFKSGNADSNIN